MGKLWGAAKRMVTSESLFLTHFTKRLAAGFFGGEGFVLQKLSGNGNAFLHAGGTAPSSSTVWRARKSAWIPAAWPPSNPASPFARLADRVLVNAVHLKRDGEG